MRADDDPLALQCSSAPSSAAMTLRPVPPGPCGLSDDASGRLWKKSLLAGGPQPEALELAGDVSAGAMLARRAREPPSRRSSARKRTAASGRRHAFASLPRMTGQRLRVGDWCGAADTVSSRPERRDVARTIGAGPSGSPVDTRWQALVPASPPCYADRLLGSCAVVICRAAGFALRPVDRGHRMRWRTGAHRRSGRRPRWRRPTPPIVRRLIRAAADRGRGALRRSSASPATARPRAARTRRQA